ncbi:hypothetical protein BaRGS_00017944 [Batillaria attramentaria]|uniref:Uncharacterized protein n=1 Tax=Batillaria attramentaria TaxID=370345 RepID=A0ABD0J971_9CAEN
MRKANFVTVGELRKANTGLRQPFSRSGWWGWAAATLVCWSRIASEEIVFYSDPHFPTIRDRLQSSAFGSHEEDVADARRRTRVGGWNGRYRVMQRACCRVQSSTRQNFCLNYSATTR